MIFDFKFEIFSTHLINGVFKKLLKPGDLPSTEFLKGPGNVLTVVRRLKILFEFAELVAGKLSFS